MSTPHLVLVPKETVSDDAYLIAQLHVEDGARVAAGDLLATLETSKATMDLAAPVAGYVYFAGKTGESIPVGGVLATIGSNAARPPELSSATPVRTMARTEGQPVFSQPAQRLIDQHHLEPKLFAGLSLVRREDVERILAQTRASDQPLALPPIQANHILVWGGGGHAKVCIEILRAAGQWEPFGIVDRTLPLGTKVLGVPVIGREEQLADWLSRGVRQAALGIGAVTYHAKRGALFERLKTMGYALPNLVHPGAVVDPSATMGEGNQIFAHATLSADVRVGNGCIINSGAVVSHDCRIEHNVHLAPGALLAGNVSVGCDTLIGMGVKIYLGVKIGRGVRLNNGATINADVADNAVVS